MRSPSLQLLPNLKLLLHRPRLLLHARDDLQRIVAVHARGFLRGYDPGMLLADGAERVGMRAGVRVLQAIPAKEREGVRAPKLVPKIFEQQGALEISILPQQ